MSLRSEINKIGTLDGGWAEFSIKFRTNIKADDDPVLGYVDFDKHEIHLETKMEDGIMRRTLLHECLHVFLSLVGVKHPDEDVHADLTICNEFITEQTTRAMLVFKALNPELWSLIFDE